MSSLFDLTGHVALITGGNGGISLGMAEGLAAQGAAVAIWGTNASKNEVAVEQLAELGVDVHAVAGIAVYLAGAASRYTTGDVITIDGGYHSF